MRHDVQGDMDTSYTFEVVALAALVVLVCALLLLYDKISKDELTIEEKEYIIPTMEDHTSP